MQNATKTARCFLQSSKGKQIQDRKNAEREKIKSSEIYAVEKKRKKI